MDCKYMNRQPGGRPICTNREKKNGGVCCGIGFCKKKDYRIHCGGCEWEGGNTTDHPCVICGRLKEGYSDLYQEASQ